MEPKKLNLELAANVRAVLKAKEMTIKDLAERTGISRSSLDNLLVEGREPGWYSLKRIADALGVAMDDLSPGRRPALSAPGQRKDPAILRQAAKDLLAQAEALEAVERAIHSQSRPNRQ